MRLALLSNGFSPDGGGYLEHCRALLGDVLRDVERVVVVPYATRDWDQHTEAVARALAPLGKRVVGVHHDATPSRTAATAEAVFVGGGNAFRLLDALYRTDLRDILMDRVRDGLPYVGTSAGTNVACPTIRTTNDMPVVEPPSLDAMGFVPFQINPHYPDGTLGGYLGESRDDRLREFLEENDVPVVGLREGSWISVGPSGMQVDGVRGARLFQRGADPVDLAPGSDLDRLSTVEGRFDVG